MYERYMVNPKEIRNVEENGKVKGFNMKVKSPYYKSVYLDDIALIQVRVDNMVFTEDDLTFSVGGKTYQVEELETMEKQHWDSEEKATIFVPFRGGLEDGTHIVEIGVGIRSDKRRDINPTTNICYITS